MNKKVLLTLALLCMPALALKSSQYRHKTFLLPRSISSNKPVESNIWHPHITNDIGNKNGISLQIGGFYQESFSVKDVGSYFGVGKENAIVINSTPLADFPPSSLLHDPTSLTHQFDGVIKLNPNQKAYGGIVGYFHDLKALKDGLYIKLTIPFAHVRQSVNLQATGSSLEQNSLANGRFAIADYFKGIIQQTAANRLQNPLIYGKITPHQSVISCGDISAMLHYTILQDEQRLISVGVGPSIPAGNTSKGTHLFEPIVGSGQHIGLQASLDTSSIIWNDENSSLEFVSHILYSYFFKNNQTRIPELLGHDGRQLPWGLYRLGGKLGEQGVFPLANVLAQKMNVTLGSQLEITTSCALHVHEFSFMIGTDLYARQAEHCKIKNFTEGMYGLVAPSYESTSAFTEDSLLPGETFITKSMLDEQACATPAQLTTKIHASLGYAGKNSKDPLFAGVGGWYEFSYSNAALDGFGVWFSVGASF